MDYINYHFDEIESTNDFAKEKAKTEKSNFIVTASLQTKGRGRKGRTFFSPKGAGLYLSIAIKLNISFEEFPKITTYTAVCVARAIEKLTPLKIDIKWVNDLYVNGKKICGILTEGTFSGNKTDFVIIGIGVNLLNSSFPEEIKDIATSVETECGKIISSKELTDEILNELGNFEMNNYIEEYKKRSFIIGNEITVITPNGNYTARAIDIDDNAGLVVETNGEIKTLNSGDVSIRK